MPLHSADLAAVQKLPLFAGVAAKTVAKLLRDARLHEFAAGSVLFKEGEQSDSLYIALDGHVALKAKSHRLHDTAIDFVPPGQPFVVAAALLGRPYLLTAQVLESSRVVLIPAKEFRQAFESDLTLAVALNRSSAEQWRALIGQIKSLKMRTGAQRLAAFLISLVDRRSGEALVALPCERRVLATWLGMVPTSASRAFRDLAAIGVEGRGRRLRIKSLQRLAEFAEAKS